jgi:acetolactate synthase I/II/III large subunit
VVNNGASGYVMALQHAVYGDGNCQSSELSTMDYAAIARAMGCQGHAVRSPDELPAALELALANEDGPLVIDVTVTRDPARMLPGADSRVQDQARPID